MSLWLCCSIAEHGDNALQKEDVLSGDVALGGYAVNGGLDKAGYRSYVRLDESQPTELLVQGPERGKGLVRHRVLSGIDLLPYLVG